VAIRISNIISPPTNGVYTTSWLTEAFNKVRSLGWIQSQRPGNDGGIGNTLEDLFGVPENNLKVADLGIFELKGHKNEGSSLVTLFHQDPSPKLKSSPVQYMLIPKYGWPHQSMPNEMSFRQTIRGDRPTNRGFSVTLDRERGQLTTVFDYRLVDLTEHSEWLKSVKARVGLDPLNPAPFWPIVLLKERTAAKLSNMLFVEADVKGSQKDPVRSFKYTVAYLLRDFKFERFLTAIEKGYIFVDFDARTHHNHGTKFRIHNYDWNQIYDFVEQLL
jgi:hypothetical protein